MQITAGTRLLDHASPNISFSYTTTEPGSSNDIPARVTYRWLGGVYTFVSHLRVYWNDTETGASTVGSLRIYDEMEAAGAIIGNVLAANSSEPVWEH